jgi:hypothetical protein
MKLHLGLSQDLKENETLGSTVMKIEVKYFAGI